MDLLIRENGDGGEIVKTPNDLQIIDGFQNMIYLALFGGNTESSTPILRNASEQDLSFWGNTFLDTAARLNSQTERILNSVALNSSGRLVIENAVKKDLEFMKAFADVTVTVSIVATDRVEISVRVQQPNNVQAQSFIFIWDSTRSELLGDSTDIQVGDWRPQADLSPGQGGEARVVNSDESFDEEVEAGDTLELDDYTVNSYLNGVLQDSQTVPAMVDIEVNVTIAS